MFITLQKRKRVTAVILFILLALFTFTPTVGAQEMMFGDTVPAGETVENDVFLNGDEIVVDGTVEGDVFAFGRSITINGNVSGSLFAIGEEVVIGGTVEGSAYITAVSLQLNAAANIARSLYVLAVSFHSEQGSQVGRDINGLSLGAILRGSVGRSTNLVIGLVEIGRLALEKFNALNTGKSVAMLPMFGRETAVTPLRVLPATLAGGQPVRVYTAGMQPQTDSNNAALDWITRFFQGLVSFLIVGGLAIWLLPRPFTQWAEQVRTRPLSSFGWGIVAYIIGFVGTIVLAVVVIAIGLSLGFVQLRPLALTWLGLGLSTVGVGFWTFILFLAFMSKAIVAYVIGAWLLGRVYPRATGKLLWPLLLGLLLYTLICMIPYLGWASGFVVTCLGLGAVWQVLRRGRGGGEVVTAVPSETTLEAM